MYGRRAAPGNAKIAPVMRARNRPTSSRSECAYGAMPLRIACLPLRVMSGSRISLRAALSLFLSNTIANIIVVSFRLCGCSDGFHPLPPPSSRAYLISASSAASASAPQSSAGPESAGPLDQRRLPEPQPFGGAGEPEIAGLVFTEFVPATSAPRPAGFQSSNLLPAARSFPAEIRLSDLGLLPNIPFGASGNLRSYRYLLVPEHAKSMRY